LGIWGDGVENHRGNLFQNLECQEEQGQLEFFDSRARSARGAAAKSKIAGKKVKMSFLHKISSGFLIVNNAQGFQDREKSF
jgi:hypothetical protein